MIAGLLVVLLTGPPAAAPVCGADGREAARRELLQELNRARSDAGRPVLAPHPALCDIARWRAERVRASGDPGADVDELNEMTRRLYAGGYHPHAWIQSALVGDPLAGKFEQWRTVRPDWYGEAVEGDFEHVGVGVATRGGQPVLSLILALPKCTAERRRAAPLDELEVVRAAALEAVNRFRAEAGLTPVAADAALDRAAQRHAEAMRERGFYDHRGADGSGPRKRAVDAGYPRPGGVGENIAKGIFGGAEVVERWMKSQGHRENLLRPAARFAGLGVAVGDSGRAGECVEVFWAQLLGR